MTDKTLGINVTANISDVESSLSNLLDMINQIPEKVVSITTDIDDSQISGLQADLETIETSEINVPATISGDIESNLENIQSLEDQISQGVDIPVTDSGPGLSDLEYMSVIIEDLGQGVEIPVTVSGDVPEEVSDTSGELESVNEEASITSDLFSSVAGIAGTILGTVSGIKLYSDSQRWDKYIGEANIYWHMGNQELESYNKHLNEIANTLAAPGLAQPELAEGVSQMARYGVDADEALSRISATAMITKRTGVDLNKVIEKTTTMLNAYGYEGQDAVDFLNELDVAMQRSTMGADNYLNMYSKISSTLSSWDIDDTEIMGIIRAMEVGGADSTLIARAFRNPATSLKEFKDNLNGVGAGSEGAMKALQELGVQITYNEDGTVNYGQTLEDIVEALGGIEDPTKRTALATAIFGDSVGNVFGKIEGKPSKYAAEIKTESQSINDDLAANSKSHREAGQEMQAFQNTLLETYHSWPKWAQTATSVILTVFSGFLASWAGIKLRDIFKDPKASARNFADTIKNLPETIRSGIDGAKTKISSFIDWFKGKTGGIKTDTNIIDLTKTENGMNEFKQGKLDRFIETVKGKLNQLKESNVYEKLFSDDKGLLEGAKSKITGFVDTVKIKFSGLKETNFWKILFGEEKGTLNTSFLDDLVSSADETNSKLGPKLEKTKEILKGPFREENVKADPVVRGFQNILDYVDNFNNKLKPKLDKTIEILDKWTDGMAGNKKGSININFLDNLPGYIDDIISKVKPRVDTLKNIFNLSDLKIKISLPKTLEPSLTSGLSGILKGSLKTAFRGIGEAGGFAPAIIDALSRPVDYFEDPFGEMLGLTMAEDVVSSFNDMNPLHQIYESIKNSGPIGSIGMDTLNSLFPGLFGINILDLFKDVRIKTGPDAWAKLLLGDTQASDLEGKIDSTIGVPMRATLDQLWDDISHFRLPNIFNIGSISTGSAGAFVDDVKSKIGGLKAWLPTNMPKIPSLNWSGLTKGAGTIVNNGKKYLNDFNNYILSHIPKIPVPLWGNLTKGIKDTVNNAKRDLNNFLNFLKTLPGKMYDYGKRILDGFIKGLREKYPGIASVLDKVAAYFPQSPPKMGPLSKITEAGVSEWAGSAITSPIINALAAANNAMNNIPDIDLATSNGLYTDMALSQNKTSPTSNTTFSTDKIEVNIHNPNLRDSQNIREVGEEAGRITVDTIIREATGAGINIINKGRG